ncbi:MAG TPA: GGDEF domain-containing protein, partial [Dissulfurispiraceae bacterium]|nr:GGDEF domain-containing protein [Dissulfurispiraceae bacterium]
DTQGHQRGDQAISEAARAIQESFRASDIIARVGGDEFAVFQIKNSAVDTGILTNRLASKLEQINRERRNGVVVAMSVGVASFPADSPCTIDEMLDRADKLMYEQKRLKRGA